MSILTMPFFFKSFEILSALTMSLTQPASIESLETCFEKKMEMIVEKKSPDEASERYRLSRAWILRTQRHDPQPTAFAHYLCRFSNQILGVDDDIVDLLSVKPQNMPTITTAAANKHWRVKRCRCGSTTHKRSNHMSVDTRHFLSAQNC